MNTITDIRATTIPDSRGKPTLSVTVFAGDAQGSFSDPSGASTGSHEARELRDADGGEQIEIVHVERDIKPALLGMDVADQSGIDAKMIELDGTPDKSRLGGNALIGVSIAAAKAAAAARGMQTFEHLRTLADIAPSRRVPLLYMNYINGGKHAKSPLSFQEHLIVPETESVAESLAMASDIGAQLEKLISEKYGADTLTNMGDEGGYVIPENHPSAPFELLVHAIEKAGYTGRVNLATDVAASSFFENGTYTVGGEPCTAQRLAELHEYLAQHFPLLSIEDPFEEGSLEEFARLQKKLPLRIVGDDLTVTSAARILEAASAGAIRAVIIKPNQVGTLTETLEAMRVARENNIDCIVSHRSGETMDDFVADLAYAFGCFGLKSGAPRKPERVVKYKRLQAISTS
ncbi:MAG: enolase C-terminal domain-like protein [Patescibacteria group bacterium]